MKLFEFLYYCLYRVFKLVKRKEKDENVASWFYSVLLTTNTYLLLLSLRFIVDLKKANPWLIKGAFLSLFVIWYFICKYYFLKKENYIRIIDSYENKYHGKNKKMAVIGIIYAIGTFLSFYMTAVYIANGTFF